MSKASSKLAAGVRKIKGKQEDNPPSVPAQKSPEVARGRAPAPSQNHPERVWPD
jgi:hypothetical protein